MVKKGSQRMETLSEVRRKTIYGVKGGGIAIPDVNTHPTLQETATQSTFNRGVSKDHPLPIDRHVGPKGLLNVGNSCYANAVLQCLLSTALTHALVDPSASAIFRRYSSNPAILEQGSGSVDSDEDNEDDYDNLVSSPRPRGGKGSKHDDRNVQLNCEWLTRELNRITRESQVAEIPTHSMHTSWMGNSAKKPVVDPGSITRHPNRLSSCLKPYQQEDAHEFLRALLGTLVKHGQNKELSSLFDGLLESSVICQTCRRPSLTRDRYMDLSLNIESSRIETLEDALKEFTKTEVLTGDNKPFCSRCNSKRTSSKGLRLATAPTILVTHLKRFAIDEYGRFIRLGKKVKFPLQLEIGDYMSRVNKARPPPYDLVAVLVHQGTSCEYGHYVAYVKQCGEWYKCNDSVVEVVDVKKVLDQQAYILIYEVAEMREKHGYPSPNKAFKSKPKKSSSCQPDRSVFAFANMLCGLDDDSTLLANVCNYASSFGKSSKPNRRRSCSADNASDDDIIANTQTYVKVTQSNGSSTALRRKFPRSSSSGNLCRFTVASMEDSDVHSKSMSLSTHRRHRNSSVHERQRIKHSLSPVDNKRSSMNRTPLKGELPPRPSSTYHMSRKDESELR
jgi:Ubiquitin carboxyl-terminal hydrolase